MFAVRVLKLHAGEPQYLSNRTCGRFVCLCHFLQNRIDGLIFVTVSSQALKFRGDFRHDDPFLDLLHSRHLDIVPLKCIQHQKKSISNERLHGIPRRSQAFREHDLLILRHIGIPDKDSGFPTPLLASRLRRKLRIRLFLLLFLFRDFRERLPFVLSASTRHGVSEIR